MQHQRQMQVSGVIAGAALSAAFAFLFLTKSGKKLLESAEPWLDGVIRDMQRLSGAAAKAREAVEEGRRSFEAVAKLGAAGDRSGHTAQRQPWSSEARH